VDTPSVLLTQRLNVLVPVLVAGMGVWARFDPSPQFTLPRLLVVFLAGLFLLVRQRKRAERRYLAQSLEEQCKSEVPDEIVTLLPEMSAVQSGFWQSDDQTIGVLSQITRAAKEKVKERGDLPVTVDRTDAENEQNLPLISQPPST
jgi:hypothetical protein